MNQALNFSRQNLLLVYLTFVAKVDIDPCSFIIPINSAYLQHAILLNANTILYILYTVTTISPPGPIQGAMVGSPQAINCTVNTVSGVESSSVMISWMGPGGSITTINGRVSIGSVTDDGNNMYTRSLQFTYLMEEDEGTYTCNVMVLDASGSQSVELQSLDCKFSLSF